jgi:hypothetical protein
MINLKVIKIRLNHHLKNIFIDEEDWTEELKLFDTMRLIQPYQHICVPPISQTEASNIPLDFATSLQEEEELDLEYASIESVISSSLLLTLQKDEHILAGVTESIESVVLGRDLIEVNCQEFFTL